MNIQITLLDKLRLLLGFILIAVGGVVVYLITPLFFEFLQNPSNSLFVKLLLHLPDKGLKMTIDHVNYQFKSEFIVNFLSLLLNVWIFIAIGSFGKSFIVSGIDLIKFRAEKINTGKSD